jgi:hypothetical protein
MVTSTGSKIQYTANGSTTVFAYDFRITAQSQLTVYTSLRRR